MIIQAVRNFCDFMQPRSVWARTAQATVSDQVSFRITPQSIFEECHNITFFQSLESSLLQFSISCWCYNEFAITVWGIKCKVQKIYNFKQLLVTFILGLNIFLRLFAATSSSLWWEIHRLQKSTTHEFILIL